MSEEEIMSILKVLIGLEEFNKISYKENRAIQGLLDLYNKEKEKNKKLEETKNKLVRYIAIKEGKDYEQVCREFEI